MRSTVRAMDEHRRGSETNPWAVLIIGAGFAGLGMAIKLKDAGEDDFIVLEKAATRRRLARQHVSWLRMRRRISPYSFSFARNPSWTRSFSPSAEIQAYLRGCAESFGCAHIRFGDEVTPPRSTRRPRCGTSTGRREGARRASRAVLVTRSARSAVRRFRDAGPRDVRRQVVPLRAVGSRRALTASASRSSAPARRRSSSCPRSSPTLSALRCSSARRRTSCAARPRRTRSGNGAGSRVWRAHAAYRNLIYAARDARVLGFTGSAG